MTRRPIYPPETNPLPIVLWAGLTVGLTFSEDRKLFPLPGYEPRYVSPGRSYVRIQSISNIIIVYSSPGINITNKFLDSNKQQIYPRHCSLERARKQITTDNTL